MINDGFWLWVMRVMMKMMKKIGFTRLWDFAETVRVSFGFQTTISASDPTAIRPKNTEDTSDIWLWPRAGLTFSAVSFHLRLRKMRWIRLIPLRGYMLKSLAAFVLVTATNSFSSIFPVHYRTEDDKNQATRWAGASRKTLLCLTVKFILYSNTSSDVESFL